jgi:hypothetical protein
MEPQDLINLITDAAACLSLAGVVLACGLAFARACAAPKKK